MNQIVCRQFAVALAFHILLGKLHPNAATVPQEQPRCVLWMGLPTTCSPKSESQSLSIKFSSKTNNAIKSSKG